MKRSFSIAAMLVAAVPLGMWKATPAEAEEGGEMTISRNDSRPAGAGPAEMFTGAVTVKPLFDPNADRTFSSAQVSFTLYAHGMAHPPRRTDADRHGRQRMGAAVGWGASGHRGR